MLSEATAKHSFIAPAHKQIDCRTLFAAFQDKLRLSDTATTGQYGQL